MNKSLPKIEAALTEMQEGMAELQGYWCGEGGDGLHEANAIWELAGAVSILAHIVHGLAESLQTTNAGGGADD